MTGSGPPRGVTVHIQDPRLALGVASLVLVAACADPEGRLEASLVGDSGQDEASEAHGSSGDGGVDADAAGRTDTHAADAMADDGDMDGDDTGESELDGGPEMDAASGNTEAAQDAGLDDEEPDSGPEMDAANDQLADDADDTEDSDDAFAPDATPGDMPFDATVTPMDAGAESGSGLPCEVEAVVHRRCTGCHSDPPVGTYMPLLTHAHFHAAATTDPTRSYWELAVERVGSSDSPMPPRSATPLTDDERGTLLAWLEQGAPRSDDGCDEPDAAEPEPEPDPEPGPKPGTVERVDTTGLECETFLAHAPRDKSRKFDVGIAIDEYYAMAFDAPWRQKVYGVVVQPVIDNRSVLHHWLLFHEPGAGRDGDVNATSGQHTGGQLIHSWAPGGTALDFRVAGDVAFEFEPGTYVVEFHYNSGDPTAQDASGVEVCYRRDPPEHLAGITWLGLDYGAEGYLLGALLGGWASGACFDPSDEWVGVCDPRSRQPANIVYLVPHMHQAGVHMRSVIHGRDGERVLHDAPFDFDTQIGYPVSETIMPGETITTTCSFSKPSCSGQATSAEMCYLYAYTYPKGVLEDSGSWGQLAHGDGTCLGQ